MLACRCSWRSCVGCPRSEPTSPASPARVTAVTPAREIRVSPDIASGRGARLEVGELLQLAAAGDRAAWSTLVERYEGLLWGIARSHRLDEPSAADVVQTTWLRLVEHIDRLAQPRGACRLARGDRAQRVPAGAAPPVASGPDRRRPHARRLVPPVDEARLLARRARRRAVARVREAAGALPVAAAHARLDPAPSYEEIGAALGMAVGSIGPTRGRCLEHLRRAMATRRITTTPPGSYG